MILGHDHGGQPHARFGGNRGSRYAGMRGLTLIELMVVVAIVVILVAIAYPSYQSQITRVKRSVAKSALLDVAARQEQYFLDNRTYTTALTSLGYGADVVYLDSDRSAVTETSSNRVYAVSVLATTTGCPIASCYVLQAVPQLAQAADDAQCATLTLSSSGIKSATGTAPSTCWQ